MVGQLARRRGAAVFAVLLLSARVGWALPALESRPRAPYCLSGRFVPLTVSGSCCRASSGVGSRDGARPQLQEILCSVDWVSEGEDCFGKRMILGILPRHLFLAWVFGFLGGVFVGGLGGLWSTP